MINIDIHFYFRILQVEEYQYAKDSIPEYAAILVPNVDNVRTDFLVNTIAKQGKVRKIDAKICNLCPQSHVGMV